MIPQKKEGATTIDGEQVCAAENGQAAAISGAFNPGVKFFSVINTLEEATQAISRAHESPSSMTLSLTDISESDGA